MATRTETDANMIFDDVFDHNSKFEHSFGKPDFSMEEICCVDMSSQGFSNLSTGFRETVQNRSVIGGQKMIKN